MERLEDRAAAPGGADVLADGGEMGALMRAHDWAATPLGPVEDWRQTLKTCARPMLTLPGCVTGDGRRRAFHQ